MYIWWSWSSPTRLLNHWLLHGLVKELLNLAGIHRCIFRTSYFSSRSWPLGGDSISIGLILTTRYCQPPATLPVIAYQPMWRCDQWAANIWQWKWHLNPPHFFIWVWDCYWPSCFMLSLLILSVLFSQTQAVGICTTIRSIMLHKVIGLCKQGQVIMSIAELINMLPFGKAYQH
jgi:hypothetical protein